MNESEPPDRDSLHREHLRDFAHEIGAPLNAMIGYTQMAREQLVAGNADTAQLDEQLAIIEKATVRLLRICEHVLDDAISDEFRVTKAPLDTVELCHEIIETFREMANKRNIDVVADFPEDFPIINSDSVLVGQIVTNLVSNSIKFTPPGGSITLGGEIADPENRVMILVISDTGTGIPEEILEQVRSKAKIESMTGEYGDKGWGRGLLIAQHLADRLGGDLAITKAGSGGTVVRFSLPME